MSVQSDRLLLVDAHVHIHPSFDRVRCLDAAAANVLREAAQLGLPPDTMGCLLLTESGHADVFSELRLAAVADAGTGHWSFRSTGEPESLLALHRGAPRLWIMAGRQVATTDGLEVLALLTGERLDEPLDLRAAIAATRAAGAIPVIPWGFGKWTFRRGATVADALRATARGTPRQLFLGDNGGRPRAAPAPRLLRQAARTDVVILPGSDPLPFADQQSRVGSFGFIAHVALGDAAPARQLGDWLRSLPAQPPVYGAGAGLAAFAWDQFRMQLRKRSQRSPTS
jgi:hypothetical protein